jgi:hypothetical protein
VVNAFIADVQFLQNSTAKGRAAQVSSFEPVSEKTRRARRFCKNVAVPIDFGTPTAYSTAAHVRPSWSRD